MRLLRRGLNTLAATAEVRGIGLHSGASSHVRLRPATAACGIYFVRTDGNHQVKISARLSSVTSTVLSTSIGAEGMSVGTVEHLMAALCGMGIGACRIEVDAPELPVLDGSAAPWVDAIRHAGVTAAADSDERWYPTNVLAYAANRLGVDSEPHHQHHQPSASSSCQAATVHSTLRVEDDQAWAVAIPARSPKVTVGVEFCAHPMIGRQWASWTPAADGGGSHSAFAADAGSTTFAAEVAPARTFTLAEQLEVLKERGLIRGGSLENALVCDSQRWLNPTPSGHSSPLRFANEPARHKLLDLIGDLSLLGGGLPRAHIVAFRAGHKLHVELARAIDAQRGRGFVKREEG